MRNSIENTLKELSSVISSDAFVALQEMMEDLDLEVTDIKSY